MHNFVQFSTARATDKCTCTNASKRKKNMVEKSPFLLFVFAVSPFCIALFYCVIIIHYDSDAKTNSNKEHFAQASAILFLFSVRLCCCCCCYN